jgi:hypothetical protein
MAHLYRDPEWSQRDLEGPISHAREHVAKTLLKEFLPEHLASYRQTLKLREEQGYTVTVADLWGLVLESKLHGQVGSLLSCMAWLCLQAHLLRVEEALRDRIGSQHLGNWGKVVPGQQRLHSKCRRAWYTGDSVTNKQTKSMSVSICSMPGCVLSE